MPVLSRLRLGSIGAPAARFDPIELELVGEDLRLRHTLLALRNGGGKSSLIALVLLLLNPKVASSLGKTKKGDSKLETDYIRRGETGIVLAEWIPDRPEPGTLRRHVTFMAMQRGEREGPADKGFVGATLPMDVDPADVFELVQLLPLNERTPKHRAHSVEALLRNARAIRREHPAWEVVVVAGHEPGRWLEHLREIGLDPGLAQLLARMNLEEGDLAKALTFSSSEQFVTQAARLLAPSDDVLRDLQRGLVAWAAEHRDQGDKRVACEELRRLRPLWETLVGRAEDRRTARCRLQEEAFEALALFQGVDQAEEQVTSDKESAHRALADARETKRQAREGLEQLSGETAALELALAKVGVERAQTDQAEAEEYQVHAEESARVARAVVPLLELAEVEAQASALRREQSKRQADAAPRVRRRDGLAIALAAHAQRGAETAQDQVNRAQELRTDASADREQAQAEVDANKAEAAGIRRAEKDLARQLTVAQTALEDLVRTGVVLEGEILETASSRLRNEADGRAGAERTAQEAHQEARRSVERARTDSAVCQSRVEELASDLRKAEDHIRAAEAACTDLTARVTEANLEGTESLQLPEDGASLLDLLRLRYRESVVRHAEAKARLAALEASCASLRSGDVLPPPDDVRRVLRATGDSFQPALDYLRATLADGAGDAVRAVPALAHAVVADTAASLSRAQEALERIELDVDAPVAVFVAGDLTPAEIAAASSAGGPQPRAIVGLAPHSSEEARSSLLARREAEGEAVRRLAVEARGRVEELGLLSQDASEVLLAHGVTVQDSLRDRRDVLDESLRGAAEAKSEAISREREAQAHVVACRRALLEAGESQQAAEKAARQAEAASARHGEALATGPGRLSELASERARAEVEATRAADTRDAASAAIDEARSTESRSRQDQRDAEARVRRLHERVSDPDATPVVLEHDDLPKAEAELVAIHRALVTDARGIEEALVELSTRAERLCRHAREAAGADVLLARAGSEIVPGLTESDAIERERGAAQLAQRAAEAGGAARAALRIAKQELSKANKALSKLAGLSANAASNWQRPEADEALKELSTDAPRRRLEAEAGVREAGAAVTRCEKLLMAAGALVKTWARIVEDAREAWETVRKIAPNLEPTIRSLVGPERNARVIIEPASQAAKLGEEATSLRRTVTQQRDNLARAERSWLEAAREAVVAAEHSASESVRRFATVRLPVQTEEADPEALRAARTHAVALRATDDLQQLDREVEDLEAQLADVVKTRATLAQQLGVQVHRLASRLRDLGRASVLPQGLGAWSGKHFLRLDLPLIADEDQLQDALERTLGDWADHNAVPTPRELLPQALAASLSGSPHVLLPKADRFDRAPRRRPISQLAKDSGGEALTAAFILFCVLARVVSTGPGRERRTTLALIDNPLGAANRFDFVEAQCAVAAAFGVQYIAATGINDPSAIERFERLITLTNPCQDRVENNQTSDHALGRSIESVLWAREKVLQPVGGTERAWPSNKK